MKTSNEWWQEIKKTEVLFNDWLIKQYRGEVTAAERIEAFRDQYAADVKSKKTLTIIAAQERQHADWILSLLKSRNISPDISNAEKRYWKETLPSIESFETGAAIGAHAEKMRLERIKAIVSDNNAPEDVKNIFKRILKDELFHERAFRKMAGPTALDSTKGNHEKGLEVLGLA